MGYTTDFEGELKITPEIQPDHETYINTFSKTRRMKRNEAATAVLPDRIRDRVGLPVGRDGGYFVGSEASFGQDWEHPSVVDRNRPPEGQPGLWCQWAVEDGALRWNLGEKFYDYTEWMAYLIDNFFAPWGYKLNGEITWVGEDRTDMGKISVKDNVVTVKTGRIVYE